MVLGFGAAARFGSFTRHPVKCTFPTKEVCIKPGWFTVVPAYWIGSTEKHRHMRTRHTMMA
jgi:hypothetical protein